MQSIIENAILKTLSCKELNINLIRTDELKDILLLDNPVRITDDDYYAAVKSLIFQNKIQNYEEYIGLNCKDIKESVQTKIEKTKKIRAMIFNAKRDFGIYNGNGAITAICVDICSIDNCFQVDEQNGEVINKKMNIMIIQKEEFPRLFTIKVNALAFLKRIDKKYSVKYVNEIDLANLIDNKNIKQAYKLINVKPLYTNGGYEKLMHKNLWVFDIFKNYPMKKISLGYRV